MRRVAGRAKRAPRARTSSPRAAAGSERDVAVLPPRARRLLVAEQGQVLAQARARLARLDDRIDEAALRRHERVAELVLVAEGLLLDALAWLGLGLGLGLG